MLRCLAAAACILLSWSTVSNAATVANLQLTGDSVNLNVAIDTSGAQIGLGYFDVSLDPLQTIEEQFTYTITVEDDGLPANRSWQFCTPVLETDCGPDPTGREEAYASIWLGRDPRDVTGSNYFISDNMVFQSFQSVTGQPGVFTGTIDYIATNTSDVMPQSTTLTILGAVFADVSAVPELPAWQALMAAFCGGALWRSAKRRRPTSLRRS